MIVIPLVRTINYYGVGNFTEYGDGWDTIMIIRDMILQEDLVAKLQILSLLTQSVQWRKRFQYSIYPDPADSCKDAIPDCRSVFS